jgi:CMP-N,N'-diacetyllegionaminic acid synthase
MLEYTVEAALRSEIFEHVWVSTDSEDIAAVAKKAGADVPFLRPSSLATDQSPAREAYLHTLNEAEKRKLSPSEFCVLLPTSPLRNFQDIREAAKIFGEKNADSVLSMTLNQKPVEWLKTIDSDGLIHNANFGAAASEKNRQESPAYYTPNGAIYIFSTAFFKQSKSYYGNKTYAYTMPRQSSIDVDDEFDFAIAEMVLKGKHGHS